MGTAGYSSYFGSTNPIFGGVGDAFDVSSQSRYYNLELNLTPRVLEAGALHAMEAELEELLGRARAAAAGSAARLALCGILPTLDESHLTLEHMTPAVNVTKATKATTHQPIKAASKINIRLTGAVRTSEIRARFSACLRPILCTISFIR